MTCDTPYERISAYLDGELDADLARPFERHLEECAECARALENARALRRGLASDRLRNAPSPELERRVRAALRADSDPKPAGWPWRRLAWAAALLVLVSGSFRLGQWQAGREEGDPIADEVVASHVRSLLAEHLTDVATGDRHTVKPWFNGRLDYAPPVVDLAAEGFPLRGGRLDVLGSGRVAALVYQADRHVINLFVWPGGAGSASGFSAKTQRGYQIEGWSAGGMTFWAVSDLEAGRLHDFARKVRARTDQKPPS